jgi:hypothetical protein
VAEDIDEIERLMEEKFFADLYGMPSVYIVSFFAYMFSVGLANNDSISLSKDPLINDYLHALDHEEQFEKAHYGGTLCKYFFFPCKSTLYQLIATHWRIFSEGSDEPAMVGPIIPLDDRLWLSMLENLREEQAKYIGQSEKQTGLDEDFIAQPSYLIPGDLDFGMMYRLQCVVHVISISFDNPMAYICP